MSKTCVDCGIKLKNRNKTTLRCSDCRKQFLSSNAAGRQLGICSICGEKLSQAKNITGKCRACFLKDQTPWNEGITGLIPWNKGKSRFASNKDYKLHSKLLRKITRKSCHKQIVADRIRTLIRNSLKSANSRKINSKTADLLGCSIDFFISYIAGQFQKKMNWKNYGNGHSKWNIDHIIPVSSFDLSSEAAQKKAFHFSNCRPMWAIENIKKGAKMPLTQNPTQIVLPMEITI